MFILSYVWFLRFYIFLLLCMNAIAILNVPRFLKKWDLLPQQNASSETEHGTWDTMHFTGRPQWKSNLASLIFTVRMLRPVLAVFNLATIGTLLLFGSIIL